MNTYKKFINYAEALANDENVIEIYKQLVPIFKKSGLYIELAGTLQKIYRINKNYNLYKTIGKIFQEQLHNDNVAKIAYNEYFKNKDPEFFYIYTNLYNIELEPELHVDPIGELISDRYITICCMITYCYQKREYECVLKLKPYLNKIKEEFFNFIDENKFNLNDNFDDMKITNACISDDISKIKHHNDLNRFAIELNPENEKAYINIMDDYIEYKNYDLALNFYNNEYKTFFKTCEYKSVADVCWFLSDKHRNYNNVFDAVKRQQDAINIELGES